MVFNAPSHRISLQSLRNYVATAVFITHIAWKQLDSGHILVEKGNRDEKICIVVGKVLDYRLNCSTVGNYRKEYPPLSKAKFGFTLGRPEEAAFAKDFDESVKTLAKAQGTIASTQDRRNMLVKEGTDFNIRFVAPMFKMRPKAVVHPRTPPPNGSDEAVQSDGTLNSDDDVPYEIDEETNEWKVPSQFQEELDDIKDTHQVMPLKVYMGQHFVEPVDVSQFMDNALAEVHFAVKHYHIQSKESSGNDSFSAVVQQVLILKPGEARSESPYKRKNFRDGPVRVKPPPGVADKQMSNANDGAPEINPFVIAAKAGPSGSSKDISRGGSASPMVRSSASTELVAGNRAAATIDDNNSPSTGSDINNSMGRMPNKPVLAPDAGLVTQPVPVSVPAPATSSIQAAGPAAAPIPGHDTIQDTSRIPAQPDVAVLPSKGPISAKATTNTMPTARASSRVTRASSVRPGNGMDVDIPEVESVTEVEGSEQSIPDRTAASGPAKKMSAKVTGKQKAIEVESDTYNYKDGPRVQKN